VIVRFFEACLNELGEENLMAENNEIDWQQFEQLPTTEVARRVREEGPRVCGFPINGTRRWFLLEHGDTAGEDFWTTYLNTTWQRQIELYQLFFDHGVHTLLTPIFGPDLLQRGEEYQQLVLPGLTWFTEAAEILAFYDTYDVRVRVYGDVERHLCDTPYERALDAFQKIEQRTRHHQGHRLFFGVCAHDPAEAVAAFGANYYREHQTVPSKREIVEAYYGEYVEPVDLFIGFDRPVVFDMPLVTTGNEDLYFTVAPSPYLDRTALRKILYDHMVRRNIDESTYDALPEEGWRWMESFYRANRESVLGIGLKRDGVWYPLPQVTMPEEN